MLSNAELVEVERAECLRLLARQRVGGGVQRRRAACCVAGQLRPRRRGGGVSDRARWPARHRGSGEGRGLRGRRHRPGGPHRVERPGRGRGIRGLRPRAPRRARRAGTRAVGAAAEGRRGVRATKGSVGSPDRPFQRRGGPASSQGRAPAQAPHPPAPRSRLRDAGRAQVRPSMPIPGSSVVSDSDRDSEVLPGQAS